jgi:hypothetical protein
VFARLAPIVLLAAATACGSGGDAPVAEPAGPPEVRLGVAEAHAEELSTGELSDRPAGSQAEQAAAVYLLGHLQRAGYVVLLDPVPVADLVRSTNVIARPPSGAGPEVVVAIPYDSPPSGRDDSKDLGIFLELARALRVERPEHGVEFAALGGEYAPVEPGRLGSRRLAQQLIDDEEEPLVVWIDTGGPAEGFTARGSGVAAELAGIAASMGIESPRSPLGIPRRDSLWFETGLDFVAVAGAPENVGGVLLEFLAAAPD